MIRLLRRAWFDFKASFNEAYVAARDRASERAAVREFGTGDSEIHHCDHEHGICWQRPETEPHSDVVDDADLRGKALSELAETMNRYHLKPEDVQPQYRHLLVDDAQVRKATRQIIADAIGKEES